MRETKSDAYTGVYASLLTARVRYAEFGFLNRAVRRSVRWGFPRFAIALFKRHFGDDLLQLDRKFIQYMRAVR